MAKTQGFDLAAALGGVSSLDTAAPAIELIDIDRIDTNAANFYELSNLQPLADSIALDGLQQPLVVMTSPDDPERVRLLSGHRRLAAIRLLLEDKEEPRPELRRVPCIRRAYQSEAMAELQLILANSTARVLTGPELSKQAERVEALLYKLKEEEGVSFPGKMRDQVAKACQVSASRLARLKVIRGKLAADLMPLFESGKINETVAYALAQQPAERQTQIVAGRNPGYLREWTVEKGVKTLDMLAKSKCSKSADKHCANADAMFAECNRENNYNCMPCENSPTCCGKCSKLFTCKAACPQFAQQIKDKRAANRAASKAEKQTQAAKDAQLMGIKRDLWLRFGEARRQSGVSIKAAYDALTKYYGGDWRDKEVTAREDGTGEYTASMDTPYSGVDAQCIAALADLLDCSVDYLLLRTDVPAPGQPATPLEQRQAKDDRLIVRWNNRSTPPPENVPILTASVTNAGTVVRAARLLANGKFSEAFNPWKELTGLQFSQWMEIPFLKGGDEYVCEPSAAVSIWRMDQEYPAGHWIIALLDLGKTEPCRRVMYVKHDGRLAFSPDGERVDAVPMAWWPLPALSADIKTQAAIADEKEDADNAET